MRGVQLQPPGQGARVRRRRKPQTAEVRLVLVGKKAVQPFRRKRPTPIDRAFPEKTDRLTAAELRDIGPPADAGSSLFQETDAVYLVYNEFKSILAPRQVMTRAPAGPAARAGRRRPPARDPGLGAGRRRPSLATLAAAATSRSRSSTPSSSRRRPSRRPG